MNRPRAGKCYSCGTGRPLDSDAPVGAVSAWVDVPPDFFGEKATFHYTGVFLRGIAYLLDSLVVSAAGILTFSALYTTVDPAALVLAMIVGVWAYFIVSWVEFGTTVGMRLLRLRVVRAADGEQIGYGRAFVRLFVLFALSAILPGILIALPIVLDSRRRGLHDHAAGTVVVRPANGALEFPPRGQRVFA